MFVIYLDKEVFKYTKFCDYTIMGVAKGHLGHGHHISFSYFAANHFVNFAKRSYYGWVNMVTSSLKRKQSVLATYLSFDILAPSFGTVFGSANSTRRVIELAVEDILGQATIFHTMDLT